MKMVILWLPIIQKFPTDETKMKRCALSLAGIPCARKEYADV